MRLGKGREKQSGRTIGGPGATTVEYGLDFGKNRVVVAQGCAGGLRRTVAKGLFSEVEVFPANDIDRADAKSVAVAEHNGVGHVGKNGVVQHAATTAKRGLVETQSRNGLADAADFA